MKKALLILGTVVVLIGVTVYADRATRLKPRNSVGSAVHADAVALGTPEPEVTFESLDGKDVPLEDVRLRGDRITFKMAGRKGEFTGQVKGNSIEGMLDGKTPWSAALGG